MVECFTALCHWARHFILCLVLVQPRKTRPMKTRPDLEVKNQIKQANKQCTLLLCHLSKTFYPLLSTGSTQEDQSRHNWKTIQWVFKNQNKQTVHSVMLGLVLFSPSTIDQICSPLHYVWPDMSPNCLHLSYQHRVTFEVHRFSLFT